MHLSLLSSDDQLERGNHAPRSALNPPPRPGTGRAHRDGVVRGLVFIAVALILVAFLSASGLCRSADARTTGISLGSRD